MGKVDCQFSLLVGGCKRPKSWCAPPTALWTDECLGWGWPAVSVWGLLLPWLMADSRLCKLFLQLIFVTSFLEHHDRAFLLGALWSRLIWACVRLPSLLRGHSATGAMNSCESQSRMAPLDLLLFAKRCTGQALVLHIVGDRLKPQIDFDLFLILWKLIYNLLQWLWHKPELKLTLKSSWVPFQY